MDFLSRIPLCYAGFFFALLVYGAFGSPTPDRFGWVECAVGAGLLLAVGWRGVAAVLTRQRGLWRVAAQLLCFYGLSIPLLGGVVAGHAPGLILRDIIPFLFLLLPLFLVGQGGAWNSASDAPRLHAWVTGAVALVGIFFGLRLAVPFIAQVMIRDGTVPPVEDALYLSIAPSVAFAAIFLLGMAGARLYRGVNFSTLFSSAALLFLALWPVLGMAMTLQRASLTLSAAGLFILLGGVLLRAPVRALAPLVMTVCLLLAAAPVLGDIAGSLMHKQSMVGSNMRIQEFHAVADTMDDSILHMAFGRGWGATVESPAVGGVNVNYTHSLITSYWMKTGLAGLAMVLAYLAGLGLWVVRGALIHPVLAMALAVPLAIDILLYASFKSLDFGLILLLAALFQGAFSGVGQNGAAVAPRPSMVYP